MKEVVDGLDDEETRSIADVSVVHRLRVLRFLQSEHRQLAVHLIYELAWLRVEVHLSLGVACVSRKYAESVLSELGTASPEALVSKGLHEQVYIVSRVILAKAPWQNKRKPVIADNK